MANPPLAADVTNNCDHCEQVNDERAKDYPYASEKRQENSRIMLGRSHVVLSLPGLEYRIFNRRRSNVYQESTSATIR
jgi:hypothetical protein